MVRGTRVRATRNAFVGRKRRAVQADLQLAKQAGAEAREVLAMVAGEDDSWESIWSSYDQLVSERPYLQEQGFRGGLPPLHRTFTKSGLTTRF